MFFSVFFIFLLTACDCVMPRVPKLGFFLEPHSVLAGFDRDCDFTYPIHIQKSHLHRVKGTKEERGTARKNSQQQNRRNRQEGRKNMSLWSPHPLSQPKRRYMAIINAY